MVRSRVTANGRTTIPASVRRALGLKAGNRIAYRLDGDRAILTRASPAADDPTATFQEWASDADTQAYAGL